VNRTGQVFADDSDVLLVVGRGAYPHGRADEYVEAWTLISLENNQEYVMSEHWVDMQDRLGNRVAP